MRIRLAHFAGVSHDPRPHLVVRWGLMLSWDNDDDSSLDLRNTTDWWRITSEDILYSAFIHYIYIFRFVGEIAKCAQVRNIFNNSSVMPRFWIGWFWDARDVKPWFMLAFQNRCGMRNHRSRKTSKTNRYSALKFGQCKTLMRAGVYYAVKRNASVGVA